ncbi:DUF397 domain-containing protein [Nocardia albiluteola]|uniref:DUF397 domain-containing protein n=1 Tax=Nocardia albiluteola TaxID=2842303 RepID=UPI0027DFD48B|nr:DUF397 domain-containing protein [Nocardia albiluteola]
MTTTSSNWFKSSYSKTGNECVEVAFLTPNTVGVRDSKNPTAPALTFTPAEWDAFTAVLTSGTFDHPA